MSAHEKKTPTGHIMASDSKTLRNGPGHSCFTLDCAKLPEHRVITLQKVPNGERGFYDNGGTSAALFCRECAKAFVHEFADGLSDLSVWLH